MHWHAGADGTHTVRYSGDMTARRSLLCFALLGALSAAAACEDLPAGPGGLDALVEGNAVAGGLSLRDLFGAALFRVQREEGTDSAVAVLSRWRAARDGGAGGAVVREIEAGTVLRAFGDGVVDQAAAVLAGEVREADLAVSRVLAEGGEMDVGSVQRELEAAGAALSRARAASADSPVSALLVLDEAAARLSEIRARLVAATGLPTLDALYDRALERAGERAGAARATEATLLAAIDSAVATSGIDVRYEAQAALRRHRAAFAVDVLGNDVGSDILTDVTDELARLRPQLDSLHEAGFDVARDRRMAEAAAAIAERAGVAMRDGDPVRALDLAAHAAGLVDELRRQRVR